MTAITMVGLRRLAARAAATLLLLAPLPSGAVPLPLNGDFETNDFQSWDGLVAPGGVAVSPTFVTNAFGFAHYTPPTTFGSAAALGNSQFDFSSDPSAPVDGTGTLFQFIPTTIGQSYDITFFLAQTETAVSGDNLFYANFGLGTAYDLGTVAQSIFLPQVPPEPGGKWVFTEHTFTRTASSLSTLLQFNFYNNPGFFLLDDVTVTAGAAPAAPEIDPVSYSAPVAWIIGFLLVLCRRPEDRTVVARPV